MVLPDVTLHVCLFFKFFAHKEGRTYNNSILKQSDFTNCDEEYQVERTMYKTSITSVPKQYFKSVCCILKAAFDTKSVGNIISAQNKSEQLLSFVRGFFILQLKTSTVPITVIVHNIKDIVSNIILSLNIRMYT